MPNTTSPYTRADAAIAVILAVITLLLSVGLLDSDQPTGSDDFAAYMSEGIAIAEGRLNEQTQLNALLHPSTRSFRADDGQSADDPIVYVWGLPLILAGVYRIAGFDRPTGHALIWYKLPGVFFLAMAAVCAYLLYRRRFSKVVSALLTGLLCWGGEVVKDSARITTDIPCLAVSLLALLMIEMLLAAQTRRGQALAGVVLGVALWFDCVVRLNGKTVLYMALLAHVIGLAQNRVRGRKLLVHLLPYLVAGALWMIGCMLFPQATSNTKDIASGPNRMIAQNMGYYEMIMGQWFNAMLPYGLFMLTDAAHYAVYALAILGMLTDGIRRNLHLTALVLGSFAVLYLLPYVQSVRYLYNALPFILMFAAYGARRVMRLAKRKSVQRALYVLGCCALAFLTFGTLQKTMTAEREHALAGGFSARSETYSDDAADMFGYILSDTAEDAVIAYYKPRALYLNTNRVSFQPTVNGHDVYDAQYLLMTNEPGDISQMEIDAALAERLEAVYENGTYTLYRILV